LSHPLKVHTTNTFKLQNVYKDIVIYMNQALLWSKFSEQKLSLVLWTFNWCTNWWCTNWLLFCFVLFVCLFFSY